MKTVGLVEKSIASRRQATELAIAGMAVIKVPTPMLNAVVRTNMNGDVVSVSLRRSKC